LPSVEVTRVDASDSDTDTELKKIPESESEEDIVEKMTASSDSGTLLNAGSDDDEEDEFFSAPGSSPRESRKISRTGDSQGNFSTFF
jgi:hypothetical protein